MTGVVIGVTATKGGVGKSTFATGLAWGAAKLGLRPVLFDLNMLNPDQLATGRVRFQQVPGRMPTVLDDSYPSQWWWDYHNVQLVPGPRQSEQRRPELVVPAAIPLIERARRDRDVAVLDMRQTGSDRYTHRLLSMCDAVVFVCDHNVSVCASTRQFLDDAARTGGDDEYMPDLDPNQVRLVYMENSGLDSVATRWAVARAELGAAYQWAGKIRFDPGIVDGGNAGDVLGRAKPATLDDILAVSAKILGQPIPELEPVRGLGWFGRLLRRSPSPVDRRPAPSGAGTPAGDETVTVMVDARPSGSLPPAAMSLAVLGEPRLEGVAADSELALAAVALAATRGPFVTRTLAAWLGTTVAELSKHLQHCPAVRIADDAVTVSPDLAVDWFTVAARTTSLNAATHGDADSADVTALLIEATELLSAVAGNVFAVPEPQPLWCWVDHTEPGRPSPRTEATAELAALATAIADASEVPGVDADRDRIVRELVRVALGVAVHDDPTPFLMCGRKVAAGSPSAAAVSATLRAIVGQQPAFVVDRLRELAAELDPIRRPVPVSGIDRPASPDPTPETRAPVSAASEARPQSGTLAVAVEPEPCSPTASTQAMVAPSTSEPARPAAVKVLLRTIGPVGIDGAEQTGAVSVPFVLAAYGRPMTVTELCEVTGHSVKTIRNSIPVSSPLVDRDEGSWRLADGVWSDTDWIREVERQVRLADGAGDAESARRHTRELLTVLSTVDVAPFDQVPNKREWRWVDEHPATLPARLAARRTLATSALAAAELGVAVPVIDTEDLVTLLCRLAGVIPFESVRQRQENPYANSAHALLFAAGQVAGTDVACQSIVRHQTALLEQAIGLSEYAPIDELADSLEQAPA